MGKIGTYLGTMFGLNGASLANPEAIYYLKNYIVIILIGKHKNTEKGEKNSKKQIAISVFTSICYVAILILSTASLVNNSFNPFLYFRF